jgi:hypothetical protein
MRDKRAHRWAVRDKRCVVEPLGHRSAPSDPPKPHIDARHS